MTDVRESSINEELSIDELDAVAGGMACATGYAVARTLLLASDILSAFGKNGDSFYGFGVGFAAATCRY